MKIRRNMSNKCTNIYHWKTKRLFFFFFLNTIRSVFEVPFRQTKSYLSDSCIYIKFSNRLCSLYIEQPVQTEEYCGLRFGNNSRDEIQVKLKIELIY